MVDALALAPHLTTDELEAAARSCEDADLRTRIEAIRLVSMNWQLTDIGEALGRTRGWVRSLVKRFNEESLVGLEDRRQGNRGAELRLNADRWNRAHFKGRPHSTPGKNALLFMFAVG